MYRLKEICAQGNKLTDTLKGTISSLRQLETLNLNRNKLLSLSVCSIATPPLKDPEGVYEKFIDPTTREVVYYNRTTSHCQRRRPRNYVEPSKKKKKKKNLAVRGLSHFHHSLAQSNTNTKLTLRTGTIARPLEASIG